MLRRFATKKREYTTPGRAKLRPDPGRRRKLMGCNNKIYGSITLRRSQEVEVLLEALRERLDDGAVEVEELDENTIDLTLNFDDSTTVHTPAAMAELFKQMEPFVTGAGSFEIETSGERWTEYFGTREEVRRREARRRFT